MLSSELLASLAASSPAAVAVIIVVRMFIVFIKSRDESHQAALTAISDSCHAVSREGHEVQKDNTEAVYALKEGLNDIKRVIEKCAGPARS